MVSSSPSDSSATVEVLRPGADIGGYRLVRTLGSGGMGVVWEAVDAAGMAVAMKILHPHIAADPVARRRLAREARVLARLHSPYVARVLDIETGEDALPAPQMGEAEEEAGYGVGHQPGSAPLTFVVTELIDGPTLQEEIDQAGPYSLATDARELADLAHGLCRALDAVHEAGVIHRDLKPSNVMLGPDGPVLIDFGIAQIADDSRLTQTGLVAGTPGYISPEMLNGEKPGQSSDWFACAAVLLFALTGRAPFGGGPWEAVFHRVYAGKPDLAGLDARWPAVAQALSAALVPHAADRLPVRDVLGVFDDIAAGRDGSAPLTQVLPAWVADGDQWEEDQENTADDSEALASNTTVLERVPDAVQGVESTDVLPLDDDNDGGRTQVIPEFLPDSIPPGAFYADGLPPTATVATAGLPAVSQDEPGWGSDPGQLGEATDQFALPPSAAPTAVFPDAQDVGERVGEVWDDLALALPESIPPGSWPQQDGQTSILPAVGHEAEQSIVPASPDVPYPFGQAPGGGVNGLAQVEAVQAGAVPYGAQPVGQVGLQPFELPPWARQPRLYPGLTAAMWIAVTAGGLWIPGWMLIVGVLALLVMGIVGRAARGRRRRRFARGGPGRGDTARMIAGVPLYALQSLCACVLAVGLGGVSACATVYVLGLIPGVPPALGRTLVPVDSSLMPGVCGALGVGLALCVMWLAPLSAPARDGLASTCATLMPRGAVRAFVAGLLVLVSAAIVAAFVVGGLPTAELAPLGSWPGASGGFGWSLGGQ